MRPKKVRRIERMPKHHYFKPQGVPKHMLRVMELKVEEVEALRLKDVEGLQQSECAEKMQVSRQTFQLIIAEARKKVVTALVEGLAIHITGGTYTYNMCRYICADCHQKYEQPYEEEVIQCPECGSLKYQCDQQNRFCKNRCER